MPTLLVSWPTKRLEAAVWETLRQAILSTWPRFQALISGTCLFPSHFPPRIHSGVETSRLGNPAGRSLPRLKTWLTLKGFVAFHFLWLSEQLAKQGGGGGEKQFPLALWKREEEGKNIRGHQLVFILCSNSNQLPVCREVLGWAPLSKDLRVQSACKASSIYAYFARLQHNGLSEPTLSLS